MIRIASLPMRLTRSFAAIGVVAALALGAPEATLAQDADPGGQSLGDRRETEELVGRVVILVRQREGEHHRIQPDYPSGYLHH